MFLAANLAAHEFFRRPAGGCGHFVFPPSRSIVLATTEADWHGDGRIELVADIPTRDLDSFVQQSKLPPLTPGAPEGWIESILKDHQEKELADVLRAGKPEDFQQNYQSIRESPSGRDRGVIAQQLHNDKTRIYIDLNCF